MLDHVLEILAVVTFVGLWLAFVGDAVGLMRGEGGWGGGAFKKR
ncbi:MAG: hypothetical protein QM723_05205 [Myxococcaceae bacterium]